MDIRFTLQPQYSGAQYVSGPFNLSGITDTNIMYELATNVSKDALLTGYTVTTPYNITGGTIGSLGVCLNTEQYVLTFSSGPIVVGNFTTYSGNSKNGIVKMDNSGYTDTTFNVGTGFEVGTYIQLPTVGVTLNKGPFTISKQNNDKIIVGGKFRTYRDETYHGLIRLNPDGSPDYTFSAVPSLFSATTILDVACLSDGKVLVGGCVGPNPVGNRFGQLTGTSTGMLYRLNNDGSIDNTFLANGVLGGTNLDGAVKVILPLPNNETLIAGGFLINTPPLPVVRGLMKLTSGGTRDTIFQGSFAGAQNNTANIGLVECMTLDSQNRIMIGGSFIEYDLTALVGQAIRITTTGARDTSWNPIPSNGLNMRGMVTSIVEDSLGNDYIAGYFNITISGQSKQGLARFTPSGNLDLTFSGTGFVYGNAAELTTNGASWFPGPKLTILSDNNILATGPFISYGGVSTLGFAKISNTNASLISSVFTNSGQYFTGATYTSLVSI